MRQGIRTHDKEIFQYWKMSGRKSSLSKSVLFCAQNSIKTGGPPNHTSQYLYIFGYKDSSNEFDLSRWLLNSDSEEDDQMYTFIPAMKFHGPWRTKLFTDSKMILTTPKLNCESEIFKFSIYENHVIFFCTSRIHSLICSLF